MTVQQQISVFDILKIGVGPSSSHTMGPWCAALQEISQLPADRLAEVKRVKVDLYGSLAKTGRGHGTDMAVQLGLAGEHPETIDVSTIQTHVREIKESGRIILSGTHPIPFCPTKDIVFHNDEQLPFHPNGLQVSIISNDDSVTEAIYYSVGGGFIVQEGEDAAEAHAPLPFPINTAADLIDHCRAESCSIAAIVTRNELAMRAEPEVSDGLATIRNAMYRSIHRGCRTPGILPGGLNVHRRASSIAEKLLGDTVPESLDDFIAAVKHQPHDFQTVLDWVSCFALAVNEENASFGRIVTAPTNGAAGVIPAVLMYADCFCELPESTSDNFLLTAGEIGCLFKKGATISAALGGCQAEIGVSSAMAAAALTECLGGTPEQATEAAEIAMEHHLGMTCDPIGGLVQIPCIERNAMGAIKAISAARLAVQRDPAEACVSLDAVIQTMWETAQDMSSKYKETSEGGLALQISVNVIEC